MPDWLHVITAIFLVGTVAGIVIGWIDAFRDVVRDREDTVQMGTATVIETVGDLPREDPKRLPRETR